MLHIKKEINNFLNSISSQELQRNPKLYKKILIFRRLLGQGEYSKGSEAQEWVHKYINPDYLLRHDRCTHY